MIAKLFKKQDFAKMATVQKINSKSTQIKMEILQLLLKMKAKLQYWEKEIKMIKIISLIKNIKIQIIKQNSTFKVIKINKTNFLKPQKQILF